MLDHNHSIFSELIKNYSREKIKENIYNTKPEKVKSAIYKNQPDIYDFASLLSPAAESFIEEMAQKSREITLKRFGKTIHLYAPLYVSNVCKGACRYCSFSSQNKTKRITLSIDEAIKEAKIIKEMGIDNILLLSGDAPEVITEGYLAEIIYNLHKIFSAVGIEIYPLKQKGYSNLIKNGLDGVTVYQETYNQKLYEYLHPAGSKRSYTARLNTPDAAGKAEIRRLNIGALLGLDDFRIESFFTGLHALYLAKKYWKTDVSVSLPRMCPFEGDFQPDYNISDMNIVQLICAFRIFMPDTGIVISTRENEEFRNNVLPLGVTTLSAGSKTNPGGYSESGQELSQFENSDKRSPAAIKNYLIKAGYDPVEKDWDKAFLD